MAEPARPLSKAALIAQRRERERLEEERDALTAKRAAEEAALTAQLAALNNDAPLQTTLEHSLELNLEAEHVVVKAELRKRKADEQFLADLDYDEDDLIDAEFWESGVEEPPELDTIVENGKKLKKEDAVLLLQHCKKWIAAFRALDLKFVKRAALAHELKRVYAQKREQVSNAEQHCTTFGNFGQL